MTKSRLLAGSGLLAFVVIVLGVLAMLPPRVGVTKANFDRIEMGMALKEVEDIFGVAGHLDSTAIPMDGVLTSYLSWDHDDRSGATISFSNNRADTKKWIASNQTITEKVRRWLHLD
jgi:hypothetical protein